MAVDESTHVGTCDLIQQGGSTPDALSHPPVTITGMQMSVKGVMDRLQSEADAYEFLEEMRWLDGPSCAHCASRNVALLAPRNGVSRKTGTGAMSQRRVWQCRDCRKQFSVLTGTIMQGTKIPVRIG